MAPSHDTTPLSPVVDLDYAQYKGTALSSGVNQYLGMRYAAAPLGDLRFRAPAPPPVTPGLQDAIAVRSLYIFSLMHTLTDFSSNQFPLP